MRVTGPLGRSVEKKGERVGGKECALVAFGSHDFYTVTCPVPQSIGSDGVIASDAKEGASKHASGKH